MSDLSRLFQLRDATPSTIWKITHKGANEAQAYGVLPYLDEGDLVELIDTTTHILLAYGYANDQHQLILEYTKEKD